MGELWEAIEHSFKHTLMITAFVLSMMLVIEYFTVRTQNKILHKIGSNKRMQIFMAAVLGIIPGCLGTFLAVSLYAHKVLNFPALVTVMIATSGDEAFVMFGEIPEKALLINAILFVVALAVGYGLNLLMKDKNYIVLKNNMLHTHQHPQCVCYDKKQLKQDYKNLSFERALLLFVTSVFIFFLAIGEVGPKEWDYEKITLLFTTTLVLLIVATVPEHFLKEHLWQHTVKKHLPRIFLWTFGALLLVEILLPFLDINAESFKSIAEKYYFLILLAAVLVGIIPESGPNLVFVFLFAQGYVPMSILVANSIVQDGHGSLPLLAESRKSFFLSKGINMAVGLLVGVAGYFFGV